MRKTPLRRKAPLTPKVSPGKPKARAPIRKAKPSVAAAQYAQRRALNIRSGGRCEMEVGRGNLWVPCGRRATEAAHVYTRPKCGAARDLVDAVIHACHACHVASQGKLSAGGVRVPLWAAQRAWNAILDHSKLGTDYEDRLRVHIGSIGPRPAKGLGEYA